MRGGRRCGGRLGWGRTDAVERRVFGRACVGWSVECILSYAARGGLKHDVDLLSTLYWESYLAGDWRFGLTCITSLSLACLYHHFYED